MVTGLFRQCTFITPVTGVMKVHRGQRRLSRHRASSAAASRQIVEHETPSARAAAACQP